MKNSVWFPECSNKMCMPRTTEKQEKAIDSSTCVTFQTSINTSLFYYEITALVCMIYVCRIHTLCHAKLWAWVSTNCYQHFNLVFFSNSSTSKWVTSGLLLLEQLVRRYLFPQSCFGVRASFTAVCLQKNPGSQVYSPSQVCIIAR